MMNINSSCIIFVIKRQISPRMSLVYPFPINQTKKHYKPLILEVENQNYHFDSPSNGNQNQEYKGKLSFLTTLRSFTKISSCLCVGWNNFRPTFYNQENSRITIKVTRRLATRLWFFIDQARTCMTQSFALDIPTNSP